MTLTQKSFSFFQSDLDHRPTILVESTCPYPGVCVRPPIDTRLKGKDSLTAKTAARVAKQGIWDGMKIAQNEQGRSEIQSVVKVERLPDRRSGLGVARLFVKRAVPIYHCIWLMYCTHAMTLDLALGYKAWVESRHDKCRNNYEHESCDQQTARNFQSARLSRKTRIVRSYGKGSYL